MAELSPFLNQSPKDLAYALGQTGINLTRARSEWFEVSIHVGGRQRFTTGDLRLESLKSYHTEVAIVRRRGEKIRTYLIVTRYIRGFPYRTRVRYVPRQINSPQGGVRLVLNGPRVLSSSAVRKARARNAGYAKSPYVRRTSRSRNSPPRPANETWTRPFLRTLEIGSGGVRTTFSQDVVPITVHQRDWAGSRTPGFGKLKPSQLPVNPITVRIIDNLENRYSKYQYQAASGNWELKIVPYLEVFAPLPPPATHVLQAENNAVRKLIDAAQSGIQANLAQNLAQIGQLNSLIAGNATKIVQSLRQLKRLNFTGAINALTAGRGNQGLLAGRLSASKSVASNWLQLQYGWKPLLSDIEGTIKAIPTLSGGGNFVRSVRANGSARKEYSFDWPPADTLFANPKPGRTRFLVRTSCKFVVRFKVSNPSLAFLAQTGFTNPINLGWEILPFSFVADWFLPIGSYLESLSAFHCLTFIGGSKTLFSKMWMDSAFSQGGPTFEPTVIANINANYRYERVYFDRGVLSDFPSMIAPQLNLNGLSGGVRAQNAVALLVQAFRGRG